jgi:hypothetical protein
MSKKPQTVFDVLNGAHEGVFALAERASEILKDYEGTGAVLSMGDVASALGIDMSEIGQLDRFITYMAIEAAAQHRGWQEVQEEGQPKRIKKAANVTEYRKLADSATARKRAFDAELRRMERARA